MIQSKTFTAEWEKATAPDSSITPVFQQVHQPDPAPPDWAGVTTPSHASDPAPSTDTLESSRTYLSPEIQDAFSHRNATDDQLDLDLEMFNLKEHLSQDDTEGQEKIKSYEQLRIKRGEQPFQFLEAAISRQENRDFHKTMDSFSILFSGPENYEKAYPEEQRPKIAADFSNLQDATTAKMESANRIAVSRMAGLPVETVNADWPLYKNAYAKRALDWKEEGDIPDAEFYKRFGNKVTEQKADMALMEQVGRIGQYAAIRSKSYSAAADEARKLVGDRFSKFEPALKSSYASILADHSDGELQAASTLFNYRTRQEAISSGGSPRTRKEALEMGTEKLAELRTGNDDALLYYATADQKTRDRMMGLMGIMAQKEGVDLKNPGDRYSAAFASGVGNIVTGITAPIGHLGSNIYHTLANHEDDPKEKSSYRRTAYLADAPEILDTDFRTSGIKIARYMDDKREGLWDTLMDTSLIITESAPLMAASAVPYVGIPVATSTFAETNKSELRRSNPDLPQWQRDTLAYTAGFTQAIIEKAQVKTLGTGLKNTTGLMMQMGKTGALGAGLLRVGTITAAQTLQEVAQDLVLPTFTQIAAAADSDIKGPDWHQVYTREKQAIGDIARVSLLLSLAGGAGSTISDYIAMPELQRQLTDHSLLRLHGLSQLQAQDLALMAEKNPLTAADAFKSILEKADPAQRTANSQAEKDRLITLARNTPSPAAAGIPRITPAPNGRALVQWNDQQGHQELFDTPQQARDAVNLSTTQQDIELTRMNRQQIESFLSTTRSQEIQRLQKTAGPHIRVDLDNDAPPLPLSQWAGQSSRRITRARERVRIELRQAANDMGLTIPDAEIDLDEWFTLGTSSNSYARGITTIAIRLASDSQGNGRTGTPLDAIQEFSEGISKHLRDRAGLPWQRQVQWIREAETSTRRSFLQNDLRSLPEGLRNQAIDEALSTIAVGYATGHITESQAPSGLRAYLHAFRRMLGEIFTLARDIRTYSQSGTMDPEFRQYLDLATGFSEDPGFAKPTIGFETNAELAMDEKSGLLIEEPTFSIAPSNPERDSRLIEPLVIHAEKLEGIGDKDWRNMVRTYITEHLQGRILINKDQNHQVKFTAESKGKAASRLRGESSFRAAHQIKDITELSIYLGDSKPNESKAHSTEKIRYFVMPVEIDGSSHVAWFNTRQPKDQDYSIFYEFGLAQKKATRKDQSFTVTEKQQLLTSQFEPQQRIGSFIEDVKTWLPAAIKLAAEPSTDVSLDHDPDTNPAEETFSIAPVPSFIRSLDNTNLTNETTTHERQRDPAHILQSLRDSATTTPTEGDGGTGLRTDGGKRRKYGRQLASHATLMAWARENGKILNSHYIDAVGDADHPGGGEHKILFDDVTKRVVKLTKPGLFGAQGEDAGAYLERWALHNKAFGDDVTFEGLVTLPGEQDPRAVISQAFAEGRDATEEEQRDYLIGKGFHEMPDGKWIHPIRAIQAWDTITPGNAILTEKGVRIVDLQMAPADPRELAALRQKTGIGRDTTFSIAPLGKGPRRITQAPEVIQLSNPFPEQITEPSALRKEFWKNFDAITTNWPKIIQTPEGPIAWSKNKTGNKLRSFKEGEPALLHFIAAANLPELLANSKIAAVIPENKGDQTVAEVHRRYAWADFPNGNRRHVLLTIERMSDKAREDLQETDQAYSTEILGLSLEILPENKSADVVNLKADQRQNLQPGQAITSAETILTRFRSGIKPEHQFIESVAPSENDPTLSIGQKGTSREGKTKSDQDQFGPKLHKDITPEENLERATKALAWATRKKADAQGIAYRKELGRIDIPWGRPGHEFPIAKENSRGDLFHITHTDGYGLSHIIEKHGISALQAIPKIISNGSIHKHHTDLKWTIVWNNWIIVLIKDKVDSSFGITSFNLIDHASKSLKPARDAKEALPQSNLRKKRMERAIKREKRSPDL